MDVDFCTVPSNFNCLGKVTAQVADKFGYDTSKTAVYFWGHNQVFAKSQLLPLLCKLRKLRKEGKPLVVRESLVVQSNAWWGISGGHTVDIVFVLLDKVDKFETLLPEETRNEIASGMTGAFARFPFYHTVLQNADLISLSSAQVNLLAAQTEYGILQNSQIFRDVLR